MRLVTARRDKCPLKLSVKMLLSIRTLLAGLQMLHKPLETMPSSLLRPVPTGPRGDFAVGLRFSFDNKRDSLLVHGNNSLSRDTKNGPV